MLEPRAAAAVGQSGLMSLYDAMFAQYGVKIAQVIRYTYKFGNQARYNNFKYYTTMISTFHLFRIKINMLFIFTIVINTYSIFKFIALNISNY